MEQAAQGSMEDFPEEVLWHVFFFLDAQTLCKRYFVKLKILTLNQLNICSVPTVCSKWFSLYTDDGLWHHIYDARFGIHKNVYLRKEKYFAEKKPEVL